MKTKVYVNNEKFIIGTTLKDEMELESNNMALHVCHNQEHILENRKKLSNTLSCKLEDFVCANQTHSANFYKVTSADRGRGATRLETAVADTDALYTYEPNVVLSSFTADCVPVMFYNEVTGVIGVVHSGWQGTIKEITLKLFKYLIEEENNNPEDIFVQIGTSLSQEKFEVDEDVYQKFKSLGYADEFIYFNEQTKKYHIDNQKTVKRQCELVGIPSGQILIDSTCTFINPDGFSYRQDKQSGRHLSFIMKRS